MKKEFGKYEWVLNVIESYEDEEVLSDFKERFKEGEDVSKEDYFDFCDDYVDDVSEGYYIRKNWEYIMSGGDMSVFDEDVEEEEDEDDECWD